jgi:type II secretory pathway component GspD/PulD (secretin)
MKLRVVACLTLLCGFSSGFARSGPSDIQKKTKGGRTAPVARSQEGSDSVAIDLEIWEVHGDEARALQDGGFRQFGGLLRAGGEGTKGGRKPKTAQELLQALHEHAQLTGVLVPKLTTRLGRTAGLKMGLRVTTTQLHYMVRTGEKSFELQSLPSEAVNTLGLTVDLTPRAVPNDPGLITISPLKVTFGTVDGHEPVPGVELEIGKPIISTRKLETSVTLELGDAIGIVLPGPEGRQPILLVTVHRAGKTQ